MHISSLSIFRMLRHYPVFFTATAPPELYTLSLHDALPISLARPRASRAGGGLGGERLELLAVDRLQPRSEEHTSELQSQSNLVCRLLLEKKNARSTPTSRASTLNCPRS